MFFVGRAFFEKVAQSSGRVCKHERLEPLGKAFGQQFGSSEAKLDVQIESKWRLETSLEGRIDSKLRSEASLDSQEQSKLALESGWTALRERRTAAGKQVEGQLGGFGALQALSSPGVRDILVKYLVRYNI